MADGASMTLAGDFSKPATVLIEKISDAIGAFWEPKQIRRVAKADADAAIIKATAQLEIEDIQRRTLVRFVGEEVRKQQNIETIASNALPLLKEDADPGRVEDDWIVNFFDKCRLISDEQMQKLWCKLLAGEANSPGTCSKRTINLLSILDKSDAEMFTKLCGFNWDIETELIPLIFNYKDDYYKRREIFFDTLRHLDNLGLIDFENVGFVRIELPKQYQIHYFKTPYILEFRQEDHNELGTGNVLYTTEGMQLARIVDAYPIGDYPDYIIAILEKKGIIVKK